MYLARHPLRLLEENLGLCPDIQPRHEFGHALHGLLSNVRYPTHGFRVALPLK